MTQIPNFEQRVKDHYLNERGEDYHLKKRKLSPELVPWVSRLRAEKFQSFVTDSDRVFEYGAGAGWNLIDLKCQSKSAFDISTLNRHLFESNGIEFFDDETAIPKAKFDVVICHHVLEHVPFPGTTLSFLRELLKENGKLILVVPFETQGLDTYDTKDREGHLYSWVPQTLGNLANRSGFKINEITVKWTGYDRFAAELAKTFKLGEIGFRVLRKLGQILKPYKENILVATK